MDLDTAIMEGADALTAAALLGPCPFDRTDEGDPVPASVVEALIKRVKFWEKVAEDRAQTIDELMGEDEFGLCMVCGR